MARTTKDPLDPDAIAGAALRYLERFDTSTANLRRVLLRRLRRAAQNQPLDLNRAGEIVDQLLERYQSVKLLDDGRFARALATSLRARGGSRRSIMSKLRSRGVPPAMARAALEAVDLESADAELAAALALVRKRRLGPHRPEGQREAERRRDLQRLARAGFSFDVARRALAADEVDDIF